mgnify:CR=1 FL=1
MFGFEGFGQDLSIENIEKVYVKTTKKKQKEIEHAYIIYLKSDSIIFIVCDDEEGSTYWIKDNNPKKNLIKILTDYNQDSEKYKDIIASFKIKDNSIYEKNEYTFKINLEKKKLYVEYIEGNNKYLNLFGKIKYSKIILKK